MKDEEQIEVWRKEEFEPFYETLHGFIPTFYDGEYDWCDAQNCWLSFLHAKLCKPVIELPKPDHYHGDSDHYEAQDVHLAITAAGYKYKVKE